MENCLLENQLFIMTFIFCGVGYQVLCLEIIAVILQRSIGFYFTEMGSAKFMWQSHALSPFIFICLGGGAREEKELYS